MDYLRSLVFKEVDLNIFIIEDEQIISNAMQRVLSKDGHVVSVAHSYEVFEDIFALAQPDLIFLDLKIPGKSGMDILRDIKRSLPMVRVIMMSGYISEKDVHEAKELGAERFLKKPFDDIFSIRDYINAPK